MGGQTGVYFEKHVFKNGEFPDSLLKERKKNIKKKVSMTVL
jgi:hypothetical protein